MIKTPETLAHMAVRLERFRTQRNSCMQAIRLLIGSDHKGDCKFQFAPIDECPTCWPSYTKNARDLIKAIERDIKRGVHS